MKRPLNYYDDLAVEAFQSGQVERFNGSDIIRIINNNNNETIRIGQILSLLPTSENGQQVADSFLVSLEVAAFLAMVDFNNRMSPYSNSINQQIADCDFYMTMKFRDTQLSPIVSARIWDEEFFYYPQNGGLRSMAVVGPLRSVTASILAILGSVTTDVTSNNTKTEVPLISPSATSSQLDNKDILPYFARTVPTDQANAHALCLFLNSINVKRFAVLYVNDSYGRQFMSYIREAVKDYGLSVQAVSYQDEKTGSLISAIHLLKRLDYVYHFGIFSGGIWKDVVLSLYTEGMLTKNRVWVYADALIGAVGLELEVNNTRDKNWPERSIDPKLSF